MSYYEKHKENSIRNQKQYRERHLEYVKDYQRLWYQRNRYHITCTICGSKYLKHNEKQHFRTQKHQRGLHGVRPKSKKQNIKPKEKEQIIEEKNIIPYKTIFVSKGKILWNLQL